MKHLQKINNNSTGEIFNINPHVFLNTETKKLQYDRKRVNIEYLKNTSYSYIDTEIIPDKDTGIYFKFSDTYTGNYDHYIVGCRNDNSNTRWVVGESEISGIYYGRGVFKDLLNTKNMHSGIVKYNYLNNKMHEVYNINNELIQQLSLSTDFDFVPLYNIRLFGSAGVVESYTTWEGCLYFVKISQGSEIIMDLIPVKVGGIGYFYDKISHRYFGNNGTGNFELGPKIES